MENLVLYHGSCYDGFGAAYAAWLRLQDTATYQPVGYGAPLPPEAKLFKHVYIVDFSYPRQELLDLCAYTKVAVLDHHKTAEENLKGLSHPNLTIIFDMTKSGALITWEYFHRIEYAGQGPMDSVPAPAPLLIQHISDRDLWTYKLEGSREIHSALVSYPMDFELWDKFDVEVLKIEGKALLRQYNQLVENICKKPFKMMIGDQVVPVVNTSIAWSEVGEKLGDMFPDAPFVASFTEFEDQQMWSLRTSKNNRDFDVSAIARLYGGGGHKAAAGFKIAKVVDPVVVGILPYAKA